MADFGVCVSGAGGKGYGFRCRVGGGRSGRERWTTIGKHGALTPDQARDIRRRWADEMATGGHPAADREAHRAAPTVSELLDRYLAEHVQRRNEPKTAEGNRQQIKFLRPAPGHLKVNEVTRRDIAQPHAKLGRTPYAANRALARLS